MNETETLASVSDAINHQAIRFEIDVIAVGFQKVYKKFGLFKGKKIFEISPLTLSQLQRISKIILDIDLKDLTPSGVLKLMAEHSHSCAEMVAIAVTRSAEKPSKKLVNLFFNSLSQEDMHIALQIVLKQMSVINFINTIASVRSLNVLEKKPVNVKGAEKKEESPTVPGALSVVS